MASRFDVMTPIAGASDAPTRPKLSRALLSDPSWQPPSALVRPRADMLQLPERAVQFGTGVFLRGFVEYFLDAANEQRFFNGRVVLVGSTDSGRDRAFTTQDGLFTLQSVSADDDAGELRVVSSVSRALSASSGWHDVLATARQLEISVVFSNTTEAGFALDAADISVAAIPKSFPAKLTRFLYERARAFGFDRKRGLVVVPCELLENNGDVLKGLVHAVCDRWQLEPEFRVWLNESVPFCNTLVDRIVPGAPPAPEREKLEQKLGYSDDLMTVTETYRLFVIEGDATVRARLPFADGDRGIVFANNIRAYRERKLRLLNGTHTGLAALGLLAGVSTVDAVMRDDMLSVFARELLLAAIAPVVEAPEAFAFGEDVLRRFANPHVYHRLTDIANQGTLKLRVRLLPIVQRYVVASRPIPRALVVAMAAQLVLLHPQMEQLLVSNGAVRPTDDLGVLVRKHWEVAPTAVAGITRILSDSSIWNEDLTYVPTLMELVAETAGEMLVSGARSVLHTDAEVRSDP
ncbi:MAG: tagaturonate reductase [Gemmatimonas sp.]